MSLMLDPYWVEGTTPFWTAIALWYCMTAVRMGAFTDESYPFWCWGTFLGVGASIFMLINGSHIFPPESTMLLAIEIGAMVIVVGAGIVLYRLSKRYVADLDLRERIENADFSDPDENDP